MDHECHKCCSEIRVVSNVVAMSAFDESNVEGFHKALGYLDVVVRSVSHSRLALTTHDSRLELADHSLPDCFQSWIQSSV